MKTHSENLRWDDVVFENRNRDYGAYFLRARYPDTVAKSWFGAALFVAAVLMTPGWLDRWKNRKTATVSPWKDSTTIVVYPPPLIESPPHGASKSGTGGGPPVVTAQQVPYDSIRIEKPHPAALTGDDDGGEFLSDLTAPTSDAGVESGTPVPAPAILNGAEVMPQFEGGAEAMMKFIARHLVFPPSAIRQGIEGTVYVQFVIDRDGSVRNILIMKGLFGACDTESMRVIGVMPRWKPGMQNRSPVAVRMALPIRFRINP
jgi:protein TonB